MKREQKRRVKIRNLLLRSLAVAGVISIVLMAPKMTRLLKELDRPAKNRAQLYRRITQGINRLEQDRLVTVSGEYANRKVKITEKGIKALEQIEFGEYVIPEPAFWDGKWRVLIFDISERRRRIRTQLRRLLEGAGFVRVQDSVWVHPYPCDEFISLVRAHLKSGVGEMRIFVAEALESDKSLREHFRLGLP
ncbi:CRISPR-associated endonuclease Cas2 [Candidatus Kaiserbacteria bacterium RIFCSPLOWO2_02_FULL_55_12]|uniref:CRISPR-associated endoribonuclease Cas2 n=2 Tax=Candidatus Kaiseribacteriota TaxID=1752734 RepID=A0A1F6EZR9_9BACT|nr:MAG: CRISPR-associated endonuclease Cas2 [Candidatus Kaiserbacteria bacterium RIFCSPHIGHO2_02_FULL_55_17]OGG79097.1 MAG: CRISPR-associated endonuclease Cas2 [Candidatus Kaiserbacteria bacterium RIFCSPLOWO2_02_FULL_55_12]